MGTVGRIELLAPYGTDLTLTPQGDFATTQDVYGSPAATIQRIQYLVQTNPRLSDGNGGYLTPGDDLFNPDWGAGLPGSVDEMVTPAFLNTIQARILAALSTDPYIAPSPAVSVTDTGSGQVQVDITCNTIVGELVSVPSIALQLF